MNRKIYFYEMIIKSNLYFLFLYLFFQIIIYQLHDGQSIINCKYITINNGYMEKYAYNLNLKVKTL